MATEAASAKGRWPTISANADSANLTVDLTPAPEPTDAIIESAGARVFLEENAAEALADKVLDAQLDEGGAVRFAIGQA